MKYSFISKVLRALLFVLMALIMTVLMYLAIGLAQGTEHALAKADLPSQTIHVGSGFILTIDGFKGKTKWKSANRKIVTVSPKGYVKGIRVGSAVISATNKGKKIKFRIYVKRRRPDFEAKITDVFWNIKNGKAYVKVQFKNYASKPLYISREGRYKDATSLKYKVRAKGRKYIRVAPKGKKSIKFWNYGRNQMYILNGTKSADRFCELESFLRFKFVFDGKTYKGETYWEETDDAYEWDSVYY